MKNFFKKIISKFKSKWTLFFPLLLLTTTTTVLSFMVSSKYMPDSKANSLFEVSENFKNNEKYSAYGLMYPKKITNADVSVYRDPNKTQKFRSIYSEVTCFDVYQHDWSGLYSPCTLTINGEKKNFSYVCMPRSTYITSWVYKCGLLYDGSSNLSKFKTNSDIFITKEYAQEILKKYDRPLDDYAFLCNNSNIKEEDRNFPYSWNWGEPGKYTPMLFPITYNIRGVIDTSCDFYTKYSKVFGDFFIVNESFTLPTPNVTFFEFNDSSRYTKKQIKNALKFFNYDTTISNTSAYTNSFIFDYRLTFIGNIDSDYSILKINNNQSIYNDKTDEIYDLFYNNQNVLKLIIYLVISFMLCFTDFLILNYYLKNNNLKIRKSRGIILILLNIIASIMFGLLLIKPLGKISFIGQMSYANVSGFIFLIMLSIFLSVVYLVKKREL